MILGRLGKFGRVSGRGQQTAHMIPFAHSCGCVRGTNMTRALLHTIPVIAATLILALQPVAAQDRSEEYEQGYNDSRCDMFRDLAPLLLMLAPRAVVIDPESVVDFMGDFMAITEECGIDWTAGASESASEPSAPEPADSARCERLAALIAPLEADIDRLLASPVDPTSMTSLELTAAQGRRNEIDREMRRTGC